MNLLSQFKRIKFKHTIYSFVAIFLLFQGFTFHKLHGGFLGVKMDSSVSEIKLTNSFPVSINENLQLNNVKREDMTLIYEYKLKNIHKDTIDLIDIIGKSKVTSLSKKICEDENKKDILFSDGKLKYIYYDKNNDYITDLLITKQNCLNLNS